MTGEIEEVEFNDLLKAMHSITITREGGGKVCRKPVSEEAALYAARMLVIAFPNGLRIKNAPKGDAS